MIYERAMELAEALESGKYQQTTGRLRKSNSFCVLGVACEISKIGHWSDDLWPVYETDSTTIGTDLPPEVIDYFGFGDVSYYSLARANDGGCLSFKDIAQIIRKNWEFL